MAETLYWIWLQEALGAGSKKVDMLLEERISPSEFYEMSHEEKQALEIFTEKEISKIQITTLDNAKKQMELAEKYECFILTPELPDFPQQLLHIYGIPCVLYGKGDYKGLSDSLCIAVVGARKFTEYGYMASHCLSRDLAAAGCVVVSGMAHGNDYAAHVGALSSGGRTVGILACGLDVDYPSGHGKLKAYMLEHGGLLLSEFPFGSKAAGYHFNIRNRLLSGLSQGVVITQASVRSGTLLTASHAMEQNRDVFAVPGNIFDVTMAGCNRLLRDGAKSVLNAYSILEEYTHRLPHNQTVDEVVEKVQYAQAHAKPVRMPERPQPAMYMLVRPQEEKRVPPVPKKPKPKDAALVKEFALSGNPVMAPEPVPSEETEPNQVQTAQRVVLSEPVSEEPPPKVPPMMTGAALKAKQAGTSKGQHPQKAAEAPRKQAVKHTPEALEELGISIKARQVYAHLSVEEPVDVSKLTVDSGLAVAEVLSSMTELEVQDLARALPGKQYILI